MLRTTILTCSIILLVFGCLLFVFGFAKMGIDAGEWRNISQTGLPSGPDRFQWSAWQANDGSVYPFSSFQPEHRPDSLPEFRVGHVREAFFDFTVYQGRFTRDGTLHEFPAFGPGWGAVYHPLWACLTFAAGLLCLFVAHFARLRHPRSPNHALQRTEAGRRVSSEFQP